MGISLDGRSGGSLLDSLGGVSLGRGVGSYIRYASPVPLGYDSVRAARDTGYASAVMRFTVAQQLYHAGYFSESNRQCGRAASSFYALGDFRQAFYSLLLQVSSLMHMGVYSVAFPTMLRAHTLAWNLHDAGLIAMAQHWIGQLYVSEGNAEAALLYYEDAVSRTWELPSSGRELLLAERLGYLAEAYVLAGRYRDALRTAEESLLLGVSPIGMHSGVRALLAKGDAHVELGNHAEAARAYDRALEASRALGRVYDEALTLKQKGILCRGEGRIQEADALFARAYVLATRRELHPLRAALLARRAELVRQHNPLRALEYLEAYIALSDSLGQQSARQQLDAMYARYASELKQHRIEVQELQLERAALLRRILEGSIGLALVIVLLLVIFLCQHRVRNGRLAVLNRTKNTFFSIISHDTKNVSVSIRNMLSQMDAHLGELSKEDIARYIALLHEASEGETRLLENLLQWAHVQLETARFEPAMQDMVVVVHSVVSLFSLPLADKALRLEERYPSSALAWVDWNMAALIVRNLLSNAIKFSPRGQTVYVSVEEVDDGVSVSVRDEGVGMDAEQLAKLGRIDRRVVCSGTAGEQGSGLGLILSYTMAERNGARIEAHSSKGEGTTMRLVLRKRARREFRFRLRSLQRGPQIACEACDGAVDK